jgi:hypothetical protein
MFVLASLFVSDLFKNRMPHSNRFYTNFLNGTKPNLYSLAGLALMSAVSLLRYTNWLSLLIDYLLIK